MARILIIDDESHIREILHRSLSKYGHEVIQAGDGRAGLEKASSEHPDAIILDVSMPVMDGFEVLQRLREAPATRAIPVILLTTFPEVQGERAGLKLGADHYIAKPWKHKTLELTLRVVLRERPQEVQPKAHPQDEPADCAPAPKTRSMIRLGDQFQLLEQKLGGGLPTQSLTLVEVSSSLVWDTPLCQYIAYGALLDGYSVAYFTSEGSASGLTKQMDYLGLATARFLLEDQLAVFTTQKPDPDDDTGPLLGALALDIERLCSQYQVIVVDSVTTLASYSQDQRVVAFFSSCKRLCGKGETIIVVAHSYALNETMLVLQRQIKRFGETPLGV